MKLAYLEACRNGGRFCRKTSGKSYSSAIKEAGRLYVKLAFEILHCIC